MRVYFNFRGQEYRWRYRDMFWMGVGQTTAEAILTWLGFQWGPLEAALERAPGEKAAQVPLAQAALATAEAVNELYSKAYEQSNAPIDTRNPRNLEIIDVRALEQERARYHAALNLMVNGDKDGDYVTYFERCVGEKIIPPYFEIAKAALTPTKGKENEG